MAIGKYHKTQIRNKTLHNWIQGYMQNIAMTPIKFKFKPKKNNQIKSGNVIATDVMTYNTLAVKKFDKNFDIAILINRNLI